MRVFKLGTILLISCAVFFAAYSNVYADSSCKDAWGFHQTLSLPPGYWSTGEHYYQFEATEPGEVEIWPERSFDVDMGWDLYETIVFLRSGGPRSIDGFISGINPSQHTAFQVTWYLQGSYSEAQAAYSQMSLRVRWDGNDWEDVPNGPLMNWCAVGNPGVWERSW